MNYLLLSVVLLYTIIGYANGRVVSFNLLTFGQNVSVTVNGKTINMIAIDNYSRVHSTSVICPDDDFEYTYTVDGQTEGFTRTLSKGSLTTHIEFFGRKETISPLKGMGYPEDNLYGNVPLVKHLFLMIHIFPLLLSMKVPEISLLLVMILGH